MAALPGMRLNGRMVGGYDSAGVDLPQQAVQELFRMIDTEWTVEGLLDWGGGEGRVVPMTLRGHLQIR